jgi:hypothetical protein
MLSVEERAVRRDTIRTLVAEGHTQQAVADAYRKPQPNIAVIAKGASTRPPGQASKMALDVLHSDRLLRIGAAYMIGCALDELPANSMDVLDQLRRATGCTGSARRRAVACALVLARRDALELEAEIKRELDT